MTQDEWFMLKMLWAILEVIVTDAKPIQELLGNPPEASVLVDASQDVLILVKRRVEYELTKSEPGAASTTHDTGL